MKRKAIRQGDVVLIECERLPEGATKKESKIIAYGEKTGHCHTIENGELYEKDGVLYIETGENTIVTHPEHPMLPLEKKIYEHFTPVEYDYVNKENRRIRD